MILAHLMILVEVGHQFGTEEQGHQTAVAHLMVLVEAGHQFGREETDHQTADLKAGHQLAIQEGAHHQIVGQEGGLADLKAGHQLTIQGGAYHQIIGQEVGLHVIGEGEIRLCSLHGIVGPTTQIISQVLDLNGADFQVADTEGVYHQLTDPGDLDQDLSPIGEAGLLLIDLSVTEIGTDHRGIDK
ncbi:uncharacterized protein LOC134687470 [Mytilus trossulus]|uniref:uncharacterized protein LOC134687470 n=1 Tax=Mytilus trossulus TaxID=6551 RepID=UPI0030048735